jgi:hypothetical protein
MPALDFLSFFLSGIVLIEMKRNGQSTLVDVKQILVCDGDINVAMNGYKNPALSNEYAQC